MLDPNNVASPIPEEPLLAVDEIQGNVAPGFNKPHQSFIALRIDDVAQAGKFVRGLAAEVASMKVVLADRRRYRAVRARLGRAPLPHEHPPVTFIAVALSWPGMRVLSGNTDDLGSEAFRVGLPERSPLLGDPTDADDPGAPQNWVVGGPENIPDVFLTVASDSDAARDETEARLVKEAQDSGMVVLYREHGDLLLGGLRGHEHFGFDDGVSQPGVRGLTGVEPPVYLTERTIDAAELPDSLLYGAPGQSLVWPGEFIFGYPTQTLDPLVPGAPRPCPEWARNGSLLVFRRYRQDVRLFWDVMRQEAEALAPQPGFIDVTAVSLAARLVGRWPSGAPYSRVPGGDNTKLGKEPLAHNNFRFDSDSCPVKLNGGFVDEWPQAKADPIGAVCPLASHIRKVNTRDSANDVGGTLASFRHRILRRGLPFGDALLRGPIVGDVVPLAKDDPADGDRGLMFLGYLTSFEDQFEFLRNRWMSNRAAPRSPGGDDLFIGLNGNVGQEGLRVATLFGAQLQTQQVATKAAWVVPTGGGYFFAPSISALRGLLGG